VTPTLRTVVHPVRDLDRARRVYEALLGVPPTTDQPWYVGFTVGGQEVGLDPAGHAHGMTGPVGYWHVADVRAAVAALVAAGAEEVQPVRDVGGGKLTATVRDPDGNVLGLLQEA
jgi:predicted enzyme related to lactoylglutathione lyase